MALAVERVLGLFRRGSDAGARVANAADEIEAQGTDRRGGGTFHAGCRTVIERTTSDAFDFQHAIGGAKVLQRQAGHRHPVNFPWPRNAEGLEKFRRFFNSTPGWHPATGNIAPVNGLLT